MKKHWIERFFELPSILLDKLISIFMANNFTGAIDDPRSELEQEKNYTHGELFGSAAPFQWTEVPETQWPKYRARNQNGSGKCGPFAGTFGLARNNEIENGQYTELDTDFVYNLRANSGPGMWLDNLLNILCQYGAPGDPDRLSENNTDEQGSKRTFTDEQKQEALKFRGRSYAFIPPGNIDAVAQAISMGYTPVYLIRANIKEWTTVPFIDPSVTPEDWNINHFVPQYFPTLYEGAKSTLTQDSWGSSYGNNGMRIMKEDFFNKRVFAIGYTLDLKNEDIDKPKFLYNAPIEYGMTGDEVRAWQMVLQFEKFLPTHTSTGIPLPLGSFLSMTAEATRKWQIMHGIMDFADEKDIKKIRVGKKSTTLANNLYQ